MNGKKLIYIISGPLGVGKSSVAKELSKTIDNCELIEGDIFFLSLENNKSIDWEERLKLSWENILHRTRDYLNKGLNVVIDFVVEDELKWFCEQVSDLDIIVKYIILWAPKDTIVERLKKRKDLKYLDRSLVLLDKLLTNPRNKRYLYGTTDKQISQIVKDLIDSSGFIVCE